MAENIKIEKDQKLIKVMASQVRKERLDSNVVAEANEIVTKLAEDMSPQNMHELGQIIAFTIDETQQKSLDFMNTFADVRNVALGDRPMYRVPTKGIKAFIQATGATTARSKVTDRQFSLNTFEIASRPAIDVWDLRMNRINMADLIRQANDQFTMLKLKYIERVLQNGVQTFGSPWYATGTNPGDGIVKATFDTQLKHFKRLGAVTILGDSVEDLFPNAGVAVSGNSIQYSGGMIDELHRNGYLGNYMGASVVQMANAYDDDGVTPILNPDWLYILVSGVSRDQMNLKVLNEGPVYSMTQQTIDDHTLETELVQRFGAGFVVGSKPNIGAYEIM